MATLDELPKGKTAVICAVAGKKDSLRRHLLEMGLTPGVEVTLVKTAPLGDPLEFKVRGYELTLRREDARNIEIRDIHRAKTAADVVRKTVPDEMVRKGEKSELQLKSAGDVIPENAEISFALIGNQNCGKTTLFNQLTGANQHVGNFPGVTVDRTDGIVRGHPNIKVTDLPGIYSLSPYSREELVTRDFLLKEHPNAIINIVDASSIERSLFLTLQLLDLRIPMVIALNMMDEIRLNGASIDINRLEKMLGIPVIPISALKNEGVRELIEHAENVARYREISDKVDFCLCGGKEEGAVHRCIHSIAHLIEHDAARAGIPLRFAASKLTEGDEPILKSLKIDQEHCRILDQIVAQMEQDCGMDREAAMADMRFSFIGGLCKDCVIKPAQSRERVRSEKIDRILTG